MKMTPEEYFKKWAENCRLFIDYEPIHSHEDMMRFAKDYHKEQVDLESDNISKISVLVTYYGKRQPWQNKAPLLKQIFEVENLTEINDAFNGYFEDLKILS